MTESIFPRAGFRLVAGQNAAQAGLQKDQFDGMIDGFGEKWIWERLVNCPCEANGQTEQPNALCLHCDGTGWAYFIERSDVRGVIMQPTYKNNDTKLLGVHQTGMVTITFRAETPVGYRHRLTMVDGVLEFSERTTRAATLQRLRYPISVRSLVYENIATREQITTETKVIRLVWLDDDLALNECVDGVDFRVDEDGLIDWTIGDARGTTPAVGVNIGVTYWIQPRFVVTSLAPYPTQNSWTEENRSTAFRLALPNSVQAELDFLQQDR